MNILHLTWRGQWGFAMGLDTMSATTLFIVSTIIHKTSDRMLSGTQMKAWLEYGQQDSDHVLQSLNSKPRLLGSIKPTPEHAAMPS